MDLMMSDMMKSMPMDAMPGMDMGAMQECIEACSAAAMAATMCADADQGDGMDSACSTCMNCADVATTMMRMMLRPNGYDEMVMSTMLAATIAMGQACAEECRMHADMHEHCRICAQACDAMVSSCEKLMATMTSMT